MEIKRLTGTFGALEEDTLVLSPGFNFIHAPNESGKSTWCALLRVMLYGLATRARGAAADKNRYAPWSGKAMQGVLEVRRGRGTFVSPQAERSGPGAPSTPCWASRAGFRSSAPRGWWNR